jgi:hypothetical protein
MDARTRIVRDAKANVSVEIVALSRRVGDLYRAADPTTADAVMSLAAVILQAADEIRPNDPRPVIEAIATIALQALDLREATARADADAVIARAMGRC